MDLRAALREYLPNDFGHTRNIEYPASKWRRYRSFGLRQRDANIRGLESSAVIGTITAEAAAVVYALELLNQFMLFVWRHSCEDLAGDEHLLVDWVSLEDISSKHSLVSGLLRFRIQ